MVIDGSIHANERRIFADVDPNAVEARPRHRTIRLPDEMEHDPSFLTQHEFGRARKNVSGRFGRS
jgi:hypothetical protein